MALGILLTEQLQGDTFMLELLVNPGAIGRGDGKPIGGTWKQPLFQLGFIERGCVRPNDTRLDGAANVFGHHAFGELECPGNLFVR